MSPALAANELALTDEEHREALDRLAGAARAVWRRHRGPSKHLARILYDWVRHARGLERIEAGDETDAPCDGEVYLPRALGRIEGDEEADDPGDASVYLLTSSPRTPAHWAKLARRPVSGLARRQTLARLALRLLRDGVEPELVLALAQSQNTARCFPPLRSATVVETFRWAMAREVERLEGRTA